MIKSISHWAFSPARPLDEVFAMARELGFEAIELTIAESGAITPNSTASECAEIVSQAEKAGIQLVSLASGLGWQYPLTSPDEAVRRQGIELTGASLSVAKSLGLDTILLVPGIVGNAPHEATYDAAYEN